MVEDSNVHSRIVGWLKIILPLMALGLLSTLFLFARQTGPGPSIPFSEINAIAEEQLISAPRFSGVAQDGSIIELSAQSAKPEEGDLNRLTITRPRLKLNALDGTELRIFAGVGQIDNEAQTAALDGLARLETSSGYTMETSGLTANLQTGEVTSNGALEIMAPFGSVTAGRVAIVVSRDGEGQQMRFTDGVKLLYDPSKDPAAQRTDP